MHDGSDRLVGFDGASTSQRFQYDANANRTQAIFGASIYRNTIHAASNRLLGTTGPAPARQNNYDAAGNLTGDGTVKYSYNNDGRLAGVVVGTVVTAYRYNGFGQRVVKTGAAGVTVYYVYDEAGHLLGEYDSAGTAIEETVYLDDVPVAVLKPGAGGTAIYYVYVDHLNTPRVLTRPADNKMVWRWDTSDPFGVTPPDENPAKLRTFIYNPRFPGQVFDRETNNHYNYYRDYDPQIGRYVQSDPIGLSAGINTFSYSYANPVSLSDPMGLAVYITGHVAASPIGKYFPLRTSTAYHLAILYSPNCGDGSGTFGGQPTKGGFGNLISASDFPGDAVRYSQFLQRVPTPAGQSDSDFIMNLSMAAVRHGSSTSYSFPNFITGQIGSGYNSNSYVSGLIIAAGGVPPALNTGGQWVAPGYEHPLPFPVGRNLARGERACGCKK